MKHNYFNKYFYHSNNNYVMGNLIGYLTNYGTCIYKRPICYEKVIGLINSKPFIENFNEIDNIITGNLEIQQSLSEYDVYLGNTALLWTIYNSSICSSLYLIMLKDKFNIDINSRLGSDRTPLIAAIYKGYDRCNENELLNTTIIINDKLNPNISLNMGVTISTLLQCAEIDILLTYYDYIDKKEYNAIDLAFMLFDFNTLFIMYYSSHIHNTFVSYVIQSEKKLFVEKIIDYYNKNNQLPIDLYIYKFGKSDKVNNLTFVGNLHFYKQNEFDNIMINKIKIINNFLQINF